MSTIIRTIEGCRTAYPGKAVDEEALRDICVNGVLSGRGHLASHVSGTPVWLDPYAQLVASSPLLAVVAIICAIIWLVLLIKVIGAGNLRAGQKWGWAVGLTFVFPVFSVLYFALAPVEPGPSKPSAPVEPYRSERHTWGRM